MEKNKIIIKIDDIVYILKYLNEWYSPKTKKHITLNINRICNEYNIPHTLLKDIKEKIINNEYNITLIQ